MGAEKGEQREPAQQRAEATEQISCSRTHEERDGESKEKWPELIREKQGDFRVNFFPNEVWINLR